MKSVANYGAFANGLVATKSPNYFDISNREYLGEGLDINECNVIFFVGPKELSPMLDARGRRPVRWLTGPGRGQISEAPWGVSFVRYAV